MEDEVNSSKLLSRLQEHRGQARFIANIYLVPNNIWSCVAERLARLAPINGHDAVIAGKVDRQRRSKKTRCPGHNNNSMIFRGQGQETTHRDEEVTRDSYRRSTA